MTTRRAILRSLGLAGAALPLGGCERLISRVARDVGGSIPDRVEVAYGERIDPAFHLLSRAAFGPWPGDLERAREMGAAAWLDEQLEPETIDDLSCELRARRFETIHHEPGTCYEYKKPVLREELSRHTLLRATYSRRQLFEVMVNFWTDHLNVYLEKGDCIYLKATDDRTVVRANALGNFRDLIRASATSPAMLVYLDGKENRKASAEDVPNENYARELLELHTLGVDGGYTQRDVAEAARCLTGWRLRTKWRKGTVTFDPSLHDDGEKSVLGHTIPAGGGERDLDRLVDIVCSHPSTARFISWKLCRRFVAEDPPAALVARVAERFRATGGEIKPLLRSIFGSDGFNQARGTKLKRPFEFVVSALRALGADTHAHVELVEYLGRLGQAPFQYPTPDGYPDESDTWLGTLLWRWNFGLGLATNSIPDVRIDLDRLVTSLVAGGSARAPLFRHLCGRDPDAIERTALSELGDGDLAATVGLILSSPAFQRH